jgi:uncharacterized protein (TIGR02145 family)
MIKHLAIGAFGLLSACAPELVAPEYVSDIEGNMYRIVQIGDQTWMKENLKTSKLNDGNPITYIYDDASWQTSVNPAYCWYNHDSAAYCKTYGALYNFYTVNTGKLCPQGWKVPSVDDWNELLDYIGGQTEGGKLRETGTTHWLAPNTDATDKVGFIALPAGYRIDISGNSFHLLGVGSIWWSSTATSAEECGYFGMTEELTEIGYIVPIMGFSVRCIKK